MYISNPANKLGLGMTGLGSESLLFHPQSLNKNVIFVKEYKNLTGLQRISWIVSDAEGPPYGPWVTMSSSVTHLHEEPRQQGSLEVQGVGLGAEGGLGDRKFYPTQDLRQL